MVVRCSNGVAFVVLEPEPSVRTGIRVEIYDGANPFNLLAILPDTFRRKWTDPLRGAGSGAFSVYLSNPVLVEAPTLLNYGNIARFVVDGVDRFAMSIEGKARVEVAADGDVAGALTLTGRGVLAKLEDAQVYPQGGLSGDPERPFTATNAGAAILDLIDEAQARGALAGVTVDFDASVDSNNAPFTVPLDVTERAGTDLLRVAERHASAWVDVRMAPGLVLQYFNTRGVDRSLQLVDAGPVQFLPGKNVAELDRDEDGGIRNALLIETPAGFLERVEGASVTAHRRREAFLSLGNITDTDAVDRAASAVFQRSANPSPQIGFEVFDIDGVRPWVDWNVGDWVLAPDHDGELTRYRVQAITVDETEEGRVRFIPELASITDELETRLERWLSAMAKGTVGGTAGSVAEPVQAPAEVTTAIAAGVDEHVDLQPHPDELSDLADVDVAGLETLDLLQYDGAAWVPLDFKVDVEPGPDDGDVLVYDSGPGTWKPEAPSGGGGGSIADALYERGDLSDAHDDDDEFDGAPSTGTPAGWTPVQEGSPRYTFATRFGKLHVYTQGGITLSEQFEALVKPMPSSTIPYTVEASILVPPEARNYQMFGVTFLNGTDHATADGIFAGVYTDGASVLLTYRTLSNMRGSGGTFEAGTWSAGGWLFIRLVWTAANTWRLLYSSNGVTWKRWDAAEAAAVTVAPTHYGLAFSPWANDANQPAHGAFHAFRVWEGVAKDEGID